MVVPRLLAVAAFLPVLLAGCAQPAETDLGPSPTIVVTDATDTSKLTDAGPHLHDYWGGEPRKRILEVQRNSGGMISSCEGWSWEMFRPNSGSTVLQGTSVVEVTVTWTAAAGDLFTDPELWIKTSADSGAHFVKRIASGEKVEFAALANQSDLPHSVLSSWQFHWFIHPGNAADPMCDIKFSGTIAIQVDIVRGLPIEPFPGHPDVWHNQTQIEVLDAQRDVRFYQGPKPPESNLCLSDSDGNCLWKPHVPKNGTIIPYDATQAQVTVKNMGSGAFELGFAYHGSDKWELTFRDERVAAGATRTYDLSVKPTEGDGPYAIQSLWEFWIYPTHSSETYAGQYTIAITTSKA